MSRQKGVDFQQGGRDGRKEGGRDGEVPVRLDILLLALLNDLHNLIRSEDRRTLQKGEADQKEKEDQEKREGE